MMGTSAVHRLRKNEIIGNIFRAVLFPGALIMIAIPWKSILTQLTFTCSKSTIETVKKGVKYVQN